MTKQTSSTRGDNKPSRIAFIGGGNMASAIIGGLLQKGFSPTQIAAADPSETALQGLRALNITHLFTDGRDAVVGADMVILAVKPQIMKTVAVGLKGAIEDGAIIVSIAAGIPAQVYKDIFEDDVAIIRCMPNTPALVGFGATGLYALPGVSDVQRARADTVMNAVGLTVWVDSESKLDAVTALSGSGPAYFFAFIEAMMRSGETLGLDHETSYRLALQTALGAAQLAHQQNIPIDVLRHNVTSPGGTTERALQSFNDDALPDVVDRAMRACFDRAQALAKEQS